MHSFFGASYSRLDRACRALATATVGVVLACGARPVDPRPESPVPGQTDTSKSLSHETVSLELLVENGGRVAWYHGKGHELIAYDAISNKKTFDTELYVIRPDGKGQSCVTCDAAGIRKGFVGQPEWHPDGDHLIIQVENSNSEHTRFNHMSFGFDNDLWIIERDGSNAEKIWSTEKNHAALHPHFNEAGSTLIFSERVPTGKSRALWRGRTPGGENHWDGWRIHIADYDSGEKGEKRLENHRSIQPNGSGFYETHGFTPDGRVLYSFTKGGRPYVDDIYSVNLDGKRVETLVDSTDTWDEHGLYSSDGHYFAFMSSRLDSKLKYPKARAAELVSELYIQQGDGEPIRVTDFNDRKGKKTVVSDFDWDAAGKRLVLQVASLTTRQPPEIWLLTLP